MCQNIGDDDGDFDWPAQMASFALATPELCIEMFEEKTINKLKEHQLSQDICNEFKVVLRNIGSVQEQRSSLPPTQSHAERIFEDTESTVKTDPCLNLLHIALSLAKELRQAKIADAKYFELFNILFGLPQITIESLKDLNSVQILQRILQCSEQAKRMPASVAATNRKRRLQLFIERHISESDSKQQDSYSSSNVQYKHELDRKLQASIKVAELINNLDEKKIHQSSKNTSRVDHIKQSLRSFDSDFLASYLATLQTMDRSEPLEKVFLQDLDVIGRPTFKRKGDDVVFELIKLYEQVSLHTPVDIGIKFAVNETTAAILRWMLGQYIRAPMQVLPPIDPTITVNFNVNRFSNVEILNLCSEMKKYGLMFEQMLVLSFSQFDESERSAWNYCIDLVASDAAKDLHHDPELKRIALNVGIPKNIIDASLARYCVSHRNHEEAISYLLDSGNYERALNIFLKTQLSKITSAQNPSKFSFLPLFIEATCKAYRAQCTRRIVDVLSIYFQFTEYLEQEEPDLDDLKKYVKELFSRIPDPSDCTIHESQAVKVIVTDVVQRCSYLTVESMGGAGEASCLLDGDIISQIASNASIIDISAIDCTLAQRIIDSNCRS